MRFIIPFRKIRAALISACGYSSRKSRSSYPVLQVHAGSFRVSVIHRTLTWTTWALTCVRVVILVHVYTHGGCMGTSTASQHNIILTRKNSHKCFLCSWRVSNLGSVDLRVPSSTNLAATPSPRSHPVTPSRSLSLALTLAIIILYCRQVCFPLNELCTTLCYSVSL